MEMHDFQDEIQDIMFRSLYESADFIVSRIREHLNSYVENNIIVDFVLDHIEKDNTLTVKVALRISPDDGYNVFVITAGPKK